MVNDDIGSVAVSWLEIDEIYTEQIQWLSRTPVSAADVISHVLVGKLRTRQSSWIPSWPSGGQSSRLGFVSPAKLKIFGAAFFRLAAWTKQNTEFSLNVCDTLSGLGDIVGQQWVPVFYSGANG